jgi:hypothetical protein
MDDLEVQPAAQLGELRAEGDIRDATVGVEQDELARIATFGGGP